jgi:hypothetical protein
MAGAHCNIFGDADLTKIAHNPDPRPLRAKAYPPIGDQLDAVMKLADHLIQSGVTLPQDVKTWVDQCKAVKKKYAKGK